MCDFSAYLQWALETPLAFMEIATLSCIRRNQQYVTIYGRPAFGFEHI